MPLVKGHDFLPPRLLRGGHRQTIFPHFFRRIAEPPFIRERISTPDGDFLDLDWLKKPGNRQLVILSHGLEGNSRRKYMIGMANHLHATGCDVLSWNMRGCSNEPNRKRHSYHSGFTADLRHLVKRYSSRYDGIFLTGFSLGGNITLKYLGEESEKARGKVIAAAVFSVPVDLASSAAQLAKPVNTVYLKRFLDQLHEKVMEKRKRYPDIADIPRRKIKDFSQFDDLYTAPMNGFKNAEEYWRLSSSLPLLSEIRVPALIVNAANDSFLAPQCYPTEEALRSRHVFLEVPDHGGHCGFAGFSGTYWSEIRAGNFFRRFH